MRSSHHVCLTTRLDRVFEDARAQIWQHVASMENRCRQCFAPKGDSRALACPPTHDLGDLGILFEFWERSTVLLNLRINKDLELVLSHFWGKKCKTSSLWFQIQWVQYSGVLHAGVNRLSLGSNMYREGCVRGLKSLKCLF